MNSGLMQQDVIRSLKISIIEGCFYFLMVGFGESYFAPFALWMKATPLQIGILTTLPLFLGALSQIFSPKLILYSGSRKKFIVTCVVLQALIYIPMMFAPLEEHPFLAFLCLVSFYQIAILVHVPAWNSWMADLLHESHRGDYFGFYKRMTQVVVFLATVVSGPLLMWAAQAFNSQYKGFVLLFVMALLARLVSSYLMSQVDEPTLDVSGFEKINYVKELKKVRHNHLSQLIVIIAIISFASYFSSPFYTPYILQKLGWRYDQFALYTGVVLASRFFFSPVWGRLCDLYGCRLMLLITTFGISIVPLFWIVTDNVYVLCAAQIFSGLAWSGYELSWFNFMMDSTTRNNRAQFFSLQQVTSNLAMVCGSLVGGFAIMATHNTKFSYHYVFAWSSLFRFLGAFAVVYFIKEIRSVNHVRYRHFGAIFFKAVMDRGIFYVPEILRKTSAKNSHSPHRDPDAHS